MRNPLPKAIQSSTSWYFVVDGDLVQRGQKRSTRETHV